MTKNPQTWARLKRIQLRQLANQLGNVAMYSIDSWPSSGDGRAVKAGTEVIARNLDGPQPSSDLNVAFDEIRQAKMIFDEISGNHFFEEHLAMLVVPDRLGKRLDFKRRILNATEDIEPYIKQYRKSLPPPPTTAQLAQKQLLDIVPDQRPGPARFEVSDSILRVRHQAAIPDTIDAQNARSAKAHLIGQAEMVSASLRSSNADPRVTEMLDDMGLRLASDQDIIQVGIAAISMQLVSDSYEAELPVVVAGQLRAFAIGIGMYVAQFSEWQRFAENAAMAEFSVEDVENLFAAGSDLVVQLRANSEVVDAEVPKTLSFILETLRDPRRATKRTVFASIRTMENLVIAIIRSCGSIIGGVVAGVAEGGKKGMSVVTATALIAIAGVTAVAIHPAAGRVLQTNWIGQAGKLISESMKLKD